MFFKSLPLKPSLCTKLSPSRKNSGVIFFEAGNFEFQTFQEESHP